MSNISVFEFESQSIRFVDGKPVANDVAKVLGYADPTNTVRKKVDTEYKGVAKMATPGGIQSVTVLEEAGIYQLVFGSKLPSAKIFQKWVFEEVLPSIRKTGSYSASKEKLGAYTQRV
ncbi:MAG: Bro-N domain-containing protein, partial [Dolichospermum sp.]